MKLTSKWILFALVALSGTIFLWACGGAKTGKAAATVTKTFEVTGMMCTSCEATIKGSVKKLPGVRKADADYKMGEATVAYDPKVVSEEEIEKGIEKAGYKVAGMAPDGAVTTGGTDTKEGP